MSSAVWVALVEDDAEFFAEDRFDAIHVMLHENEFLLRVRKAFEEAIERVRKAIQFFHEALFHFFKAFVYGGQDSDVLRGEAFLNPFVLGSEALLNLVVLLCKSLINRVKDDRSLLRGGGLCQWSVRAERTSFLAGRV